MSLYELIEQSFTKKTSSSHKKGINKSCNDSF